MYLIQVTLLSGATPIAPSDLVVARNLNFNAIVIQNNAAHVVRVGDSTVSSTVGIALAAGSSTTQPPFVVAPLAQAETLSDWFLYGTVGDKIDVMVFA